MLFTLAIYIGRGLNEHDLFISIKLYYVKLKNHPCRMASLKIINVLKWGLSISDALIIVLLFLFVNKIDPSFIDGSATF